ncbi:TetR/AcrR family transcriptional regulator [Mycobacterium sp. URHB0044]|uniref:TetR/AcrR family transcriptional regulator n=1 Tax=Mycobacterium sp. URHB0044 TaxID=1380386 RepID=UPI00048DFB50|nr:TetR/AcrR family transcriptional regulator [Mycobacterium sp. URHB0044]
MRRRPKDRKAQIAKASVDAFGDQGYHAVSMEDIASRVGISAAALYRHSHSKYDLFRDAVLALGQQLVDATAFADGRPADAETLDELIKALIDTTIANRTAGGLFRWEGRYLLGDDQAALANQIVVVNRRVQRPLLALRPKLTSRQRWTLSAATLSVIGSITDHRDPLAVTEIRAALADMAAGILAADLPSGRGLNREPAPAPNLATVAGNYEVLLHESMRLFNERGYRETGMEHIAAAVGIPVSSIYRYFPGKAAILAASYRRAADRLSADLSQVVATTNDPRLALTKLIDAYVGRSFAEPELAYVYYTERHNLPRADALALSSLQRSTVESWARLAVAARPGMSLGQGRYAVHAAFALAVDVGRLVHPDSSPRARSTVRRLMEITLLGTPTPTARPGRKDD